MSLSLCIDSTISSSSSHPDNKDIHVSFSCHKKRMRCIFERSVFKKCKRSNQSVLLLLARIKGWDSGNYGDSGSMSPKCIKSISRSVAFHTKSFSYCSFFHDTDPLLTNRYSQSIAFIHYVNLNMDKEVHIQLLTVITDLVWYCVFFRDSIHPVNNTFFDNFSRLTYGQMSFIKVNDTWSLA